MMAKPLIQDLQNANPNVVVRKLMEDLLDNKRTEIDVLTSVAPMFNAVRALVGDPCFNGLNELVGIIESLPSSDRSALVTKLVAVAKAPVAPVEDSKKHAKSAK